MSTLGAAATRAESLVSSLFYLGAARASVACMNLLATSRLAHALGTENFGINNFAISYVSYFLIVVNLGFETYLTREVAFGSSNLRGLVSSVLTMRLLLATAMGVLLFASLPLLHLTPTARLVLLIQGSILFSSAIGLTCVYQGLQRMRVVAWREFAASLVNMIGVLWLVRTQDDLVAAACIAAGTQMMINLPILAQFAKDFGAPRIRLPTRGDIRMARGSMIYFWSLLMITITYNTHIVMLGQLRDDTEVGLFAAGWKLFVFSIAVPNLIATLFLPRIANLMSRPDERYRAIELFMQAIAVCAIPVAAFGCALTTQILGFLFGASYLPASTTLALLLLNGLVVALNIGFGTSMTAIGRQAEFFRVVAFGAGVGVVLNALLIPRFGAGGAAFATLVDETVILGLFVLNCPEVPLARLLGYAVRCVIAVIPATVAIHFMASAGVMQGSNLAVLLSAGVAGSVIYALALRCLRIDLRAFAGDLRRLR